MAFQRGIDGSEPLRPEPITRQAGPQEERRVSRGVLGVGTLACPSCDAPVAPVGCLTPAERLECPYCRHDGVVREFLTLGAPTRPARVDVRVVLGERAQPRARS